MLDESRHSEKVVVKCGLDHEPLLRTENGWVSRRGIAWLFGESAAWNINVSIA